uniref:Alpha-2-macroglobulin domain-containing protein n=1 Tax=Sinocyclocheilus anshuiensis TaxID=1608454 RepID=A0A671LMT4_9TELE
KGLSIIRHINLQSAVCKWSYTLNIFLICIFQVPVVTVESVASVNVAIQGAETSLKKTTQILIKPPQNLLFIQSDKPIYKPGQTIKFRIVSLDSGLLPHNQDPYSNRIGQWLNQATRIGILDLSHSMSPEAAQGFYTITAWDDKNQQISHTFEIKEYVLPKYEVNIDFPSVITSQDNKVTLKVHYKGEQTDSQDYPSSYIYVRPFHSKSKSFLMLTKAPGKLSCNSDATVTASYIIQGNALKTGQKTLDFFYIVRLTLTLFFVVVVVCPSIAWSFFFFFKEMASLTPHAQVVVYTVLPNGEAVADSMNFPIEECLPNKMSLKFSSPTALPGERTSLYLKASPGSLCSVRAIDQSVLLLRPEAEIWKCPFYLIVFTNYQIQTATMEGGVDLVGPETGLGPNGEKRTQKIRKFFPETWIWDLIPVGISGYVDVAKTVPDTITKWAAGAFCTSHVGFGVAPKTDLTAFKPFFVSLTLPYSVIRGETFTLKATVFNYLPKCIMVKVTLADSPQFTAQPCRGCTYTQCVCSEESKTFQWTVAPSELGKVNIIVHAGAVQSRELCGNEVVTWPDKGRTDTVMQSVLVEAEGTKQSVTQNELICLTGLWNYSFLVFIHTDGYIAFLTIGDLMGRALKNIGDLLAMPYGCGEQNMLRFAPNIYILQYLESSGQLTPEIKNQAITFLESGYQRQLTYKHDDGSYSAFGRTGPSGNTWLTAFVMKSFSGAKKYIFIDQANIDQAKDWLGLQQQSNGCFASVGKLFNNMLKGGVNDEVTLSAYITAALLELGIQATDPMVAKSLACLKESSRNIDNTYVTALLSYTFTLAGDEQMRQNLLSNLDKQAKREGVGRYWTLADNAQPMGSVEVEMSAYVLLALLSGPSLPGFGLNYAAGIVHWLSKQQNAYGGFSSTQDTVVALQALAKYSAATYNAEGFISVTVTSPSGQRYQFTVNRNNRLLYQEKQLQEATGTYKLRAEGKGCVFVQVCALPPLMHILSSRNSSSRNEGFHHVLTLMSVQTCVILFLQWIREGSHKDLELHKDEYCMMCIKVI